MRKDECSNSGRETYEPRVVREEVTNTHTRLT